MSVRYEILSDNTIEVFYDDATVPSLRQPHWPNGDAWEDAAEAESWAKLYIAHFFISKKRSMSVRDITEGRATRAIAVDLGIATDSIWQNTGDAYDISIMQPF